MTGSRRLDEQKDRFLGIAAHDLRSPLGVIESAAELLYHDGRLPPPERGQFFEMILRTCRSLRNLLNSLLDITKIEQGKIDICRRQVEIRQFVAAIANMNRQISQSKGIRLLADVDCGSPDVVFDPDRIEQVLNNLIANAVKFSESGTTIRLEVRCRPSEIEFAVSDEGLGIDRQRNPGALWRVPADQHQSHGGRTRLRARIGDLQATGCLARRQDRRGERAGQGKPFFFHIARWAGGTESMKVEAMSSSLTTIRPLSAWSRNSAAAIGLKAQSWSSGDAFLAAYAPTGPGCLVLDVRMPGMSGLELQKELNQRGAALPIILITGHADVRMAVEAMKAGALEFFEKPFRTQDLCDKIQEAVKLDKEKWQRRKERENAESRIGSLTPAERQVMELIADGKTNKEIAAELDLSLRAVEDRRARMMKRLQVKSRAELLRLLK